MRLFSTWSAFDRSKKDLQSAFSNAIFYCSGPSDLSLNSFSYDVSIPSIPIQKIDLPVVPLPVRKRWDHEPGRGHYEGEGSLR